MAALGRDGFRDLRARIRMARLRVARWWVRRKLARAEAELGWLGWEQVEFYDEEVAAEARKIKEFEDAQASLQNSSAELSARRTALEDELGREKAIHDQAQASLAAERAPMAAEMEQAAGTLRLKVAAIERFERAIAELGRMERGLEAQSNDFLRVRNPSIEIRAQARAVSDEMVRLGAERKLLMADQATARQEIAALEAGMARLEAELRRMDAGGAEAGERLAAATRRLSGEVRLLERERRKSNVRMSRLDRKKRQPYRSIGACLADHGIAPLNQPAILDTVVTLREREVELGEWLAVLRAECAAADAGLLIAFYLLVAAVLFAVAAVGAHFL